MRHANKKCLALKLLLIIFVAIDSSAQVTQKSVVDSTETWIKKIVAEYTNINSDTAKFRKEEKKVFGQSSEGGSLEKYYDGKTLRKAILILFGETGKLVSEYYFLNLELIFVHENDLTYNAPFYLGKTEIKSEEVNKFYFKNQRLIRWSVNDSKIQEGFLYPDKEEELLNDLKLIF
jgi:hypothetical protein